MTTGNIEKLYVLGTQVGTNWLRWSRRNLDIVFANKINELIQEVNKLKTERKEE
nr:MAG TPA: hypothetical protein [Caudoviricetes sp.]